MFCKRFKFLLPVFILTITCVTGFAQYHFNHITTPQGTFEYGVTALYQDHRGFIWIGTVQGLFRYDGHNLQEYHHNRYDSTSLSDNHIHAIVEDKDGFLWVGTNEGVSRMNPYTYECTNFKHDAQKPGTLNWDFDNFVFTDNEHRIWVGNSRGLSLWDENKDQFRLLYNDGNNTLNVNAFVKENSDSYWFSRRGGIVNYQPSTHTFQFYPLTDKLNGAGAITLFIDHNGAIWTGAWGLGLFRFDKSTHHFTNYIWNDLSHDDKNLVNIPFCIMENTDAYGKYSLWVGTTEGLMIINNDTFPKILLHHVMIKHDVLDLYSIGEGNVDRFLKDNEGNIWIGTDHGVSSLIASRQHFKMENDHPAGNISCIKKFAADSVSKSKKDTAASAQQPIKAYNNYDFVPGNDILFEDNFQDTQDGEFPDHWGLIAGQGVVNKQGDKMAFLLTDGNYARVNPLIKGKNYFSDPFTVEFDYYSNSSYSPLIFLETDQGERDVAFSGNGEVSTSYFTHDFSSPYPDNNANLSNKWHHAALIYKNKQIKCYVDQYRVLVIPNCGFMVDSVEFGGIGGQDKPITFTNIKIANGGNMNMLDQINTTGKFMTHAITFDVDKSTIKPESMGFLNQLVIWLKTNSTVKLEIDGYTDNTGAVDHNQTLSQQRADAVKAQLITMGIDASRFTSKGLGAAKPISTNDTPEGRANNRRVELLKI